MSNERMKRRLSSILIAKYSPAKCSIAGNTLTIKYTTPLQNTTPVTSRKCPLKDNIMTITMNTVVRNIAVLAEMCIRCRLNATTTPAAERKHDPATAIVNFKFTGHWLLFALRAFVTTSSIRSTTFTPNRIKNTSDGKSAKYHAKTWLYSNIYYSGTISSGDKIKMDRIS